MLPCCSWPHGIEMGNPRVSGHMPEWLRSAALPEPAAFATGFLVLKMPDGAVLRIRRCIHLKQEQSTACRVDMHHTLTRAIFRSEYTGRSPSEVVTGGWRGQAVVERLLAGSSFVQSRSNLYYMRQLPSTGRDGQQCRCPVMPPHTLHTSGIGGNGYAVAGSAVGRGTRMMSRACQGWIKGRATCCSLGR